VTFDHFSTALIALGPGLKNHMWQSTVFSAVAALLALCMRKNYARTRYLIWLAASLKFLVPFSILVSLGSVLMPPHQPAPTVTAVYNLMDEVGQPFAALPGPAPTISSGARLHNLSWSQACPILIALVWGLGFLSVLTVWCIYWRRVCLAIRRARSVDEGPELLALRGLEQTGSVRTPIQLRLSDSNLGPGVYGMTRPILIWPSRISQRLNDAQIKSILAHELCHVRRHDNLTASIHMLVEAVFWFHPLVWWLGSRLELERERACDEHALQFTKAPHIYAESILKVCELCLESPLQCVSGVTGADLKGRVRRIMTSHMGQGLTLSRKALLAATAFGAIAVPILFGQVAHSHLAQESAIASESLLAGSNGLSPEEQSQTDDPQAKTQQGFEVATIKPVENGPKTARFITFQGTNRFVVKDYNLKLLIAAAYDMNPKTISGGPAWVESDYYDIVALTPGQGRPSHDQQMAMLRKLLADRFTLTFHREQKEFSIYALQIAKDGPKLQATTLSASDPSSVGPGMVYPQRIVMPARNATMQDFASLLQRAILDRPVVDMTGLSGRYDFSLEWAPDETQFRGEVPAASADAQSPPLFAAVKQQLGLNLEPRKGPVSAIIIDAVGHPSAN
jgi:bla regulator protein blaR1